MAYDPSFDWELHGKFNGTNFRVERDHWKSLGSDRWKNGRKLKSLEIGLNTPISIGKCMTNSMELFSGSNVTNGSR